MRYLPVMSRLVVVTVLGLLLVPATAFAAPAPSASPTAAAQSSAQDGGVIEGKVTNVDYARGIVTVDSTRQGKVDVATMPSTSVQSDDPGYHTLTDVSKGSKVQIFISKTAGKLVAQIIRLIKH
jgi:hypothetical protein